jgi:hypothetical protein
MTTNESYDRHMRNRLRQRPISTATDPREAARRALALLDDGGVFIAPPVSLAPRLRPDFEGELTALGTPAPSVLVRCKGVERCSGYRLARWRYDPDWHAITPDHRQTAAWTQGAPPWLDRANARKGTIETAGGAGAMHDGLGTQNYRCPTCGRNVPVRVERRFRLYLETIAKDRQEVWI